MFHNLARMATDRFAEYRAEAEACRRTADLFPHDRMGQEFAELAKRWRSIAEQSATSELAA